MLANLERRPLLLVLLLLDVILVLEVVVIALEFCLFALFQRSFSHLVKKSTTTSEYKYFVCKLFQQIKV